MAVWHVVLLKPRADLRAEQRRQFVDVLRRAVTSIPSVRGVRFGRRVTHGAGYERTAPDAGAFLAIIEFDNRAGLEAYLAHPAHAELGVAFGESLSAALVYDFEMLADNSEELGAALAPLIEDA
jgi:hypothetical protein